MYDFKETAYIKNGNLGYEFTHTVDKNGNVLYAKSMYFWVVTLDGSSKLPDNSDLVILAATEVGKNPSYIVTPLEDEIQNNRPFTFKMNFKEQLQYINSKMVWNLYDKDNFITHWNNGKNGRRVEQTGKHAKTRTIETVGH